MRRKSVYLPQEIWNHIFDKLDEPDLERVSLVSKQFLLITNPLKTCLTILDETLPVLLGVLRRFQYLESITICSTAHYDDLLRHIANSDLRSQGRKNLKALTFGKDCSLDDNDLVAMADLFPWLEEITIPIPAESPAFKYLQLKLLDLKKISFKWKGPIEISLSLNWPNLEAIDIGDFDKTISEEKIGFMMRHCPKLTSFKLPYFNEAPPNSNLSIQNSITYAKKLDTFSFHQGCMSKANVVSFVEAKLPLKKLQIYGPMEIDYLMMLLQACSSIQELNLLDCTWLSDISVERISQYLPRLNHIHLRLCYRLSIASFSVLTKNCPLLQGIKLSFMNTIAGEVSSTKHEKVSRLDMSYNRYLDDKTLIKVLWLFPNLQSINLSCCEQITGEGVQQILKTCVSLTELNIFNLTNASDIFGKDFEGRTIGLKILEARRTGMGDDALYKIGKICTCLEFLSISGCKQVTKTGVMEVFRNCKRLKKINLHECRSLSNKLLGDLVSKSSIKRIVLPDNLFLVREKEKMEFWNSGCKLCDSSDKEFARRSNTW